MDVLCGPLSGGLMGINKHYQPGDAPREKRVSAHFFFAINIASFTAITEFKAEIDRQIRMTRQATPRSGFTRVTLPGEIEWELTQERLANGIPLHQKPVRELEQPRLARWLKDRPRLLAAAAGVVLARRRLEAERQPLRRPDPLQTDPDPEEQEGLEWEELRRTTLELKCDVGELRSEMTRIARSVQLMLDMLDQARSAEGS